MARAVFTWFFARRIFKPCRSSVYCFSIKTLTDSDATANAYVWHGGTYVGPRLSSFHCSNVNAWEDVLMTSVGEKLIDTSVFVSRWC